MSYPVQSHSQETTKPVPEGLVNRSARVVGDLAEIELRLLKIGEALLGPEPRDASNQPPSPMPSLQRNLDDAFGAIGRIHQAITRIETRV